MYTSVVDGTGVIIAVVDFYHSLKGYQYLAAYAMWQ